MCHTRKAVIHQLALLVDLLRYSVGLALLCTPALALNPDRDISQYAHSAWRMQDGFFNGRVNVITQTTDGYLWFGTNTGLLRFDGVRFTPWAPADGTKLPHSAIHALLGSHDGSLWIGNRDGLFRWKNENLTRISNVPGPVGGGIVEDSKGVIWAVRSADDAGGPFCRISNERSRCLTGADGIPAGISVIESVIADAGGSLWLGTNNLLLRWKNSSPTVYKPLGLESNSSIGVDGLAASPDGSLWAGMAVAGHGLGLEHLIDGAWKPLLTPQLDGSTLNVTDLLFDRDGALWIGTVDQGIYHYSHGRVDHFRRSDGLSSDFVSRFFEDKEGTVWVITPQGVDSFHNLSVVSWSAREGLTADNVVSVAAAHDGTVWVGNAGGLDSIKDGKVSSIRAGKGLPGNQVRSIFEDSENRLWVGVDNDLTVLQNGHFKKISRPDGSSIGPVRDITEDSQNNLWIESGWDKELLRIRDFKVVEQFRLPDISSGRALAADAQGNLWLGLKTGDLARFRDGHTEVIHSPLAAGTRIRQVVANPDGSVLAATTSGVIAWRDGQQSTLGTRNGLPCDGINGLIWDSHRNLWLHAACGLVEIEQSELQRWWQHPESAVQFRYMDTLDGVLPGNAYYQPAARSKDGGLWFANGSVLQMIDPDNLIRNSIPPPVHVEEIVADRRNYPANGLARIPPLTRNLEIDYTALSFVAPQKVRFRYRLDGYDKDWQDSGTRRQAFYTDLPPGNYQFRVIASNNDGVWNESAATTSFYVVPAFYQTSWFLFLCAIAAVSGLYMIYLIHLKQVTRRIQEQLATRVEERERIARELHDTLLQGFHGLMLRFQSVLKNIPPEAPARRMMETALDRADEVLLEGRQRVHNLREEGMPGNGPWENLARWANELAQSRDTRFSAAIVGTPQPLDPTVCDEVYQIGREALNNAFLHAYAKQIEMEITYDRKSLRLVVRDDGAGMDNEILERGRSGHWGLSGMRERSQRICAQLNIWSHGGAGTEIDLLIPAKVAYRHMHKKSGWNEFKRRVARQSE